jgi:putative ABC transport system permease protein
MALLKIALRNITRQKKRSFLLGGAIAFGILVITLLNSFTSGMVNNIKENFSQMLAGHIFIQGSEVMESGRVLNVIRDDFLLRQLIDETGIDAQYITKRSGTFATLIFGSKELLQKIDGVNWGQESYFKDRLLLAEGDFTNVDDPRAIIISTSAQEKLGIQVGETLLARIQTITGQQNIGEFHVIALARSTDIIGELSAYGNIDYLNDLINLKNGEFQSFNIFLNNMEEMDEQGAALYKALSKKAVVYTRDNELPQGEEDREVKNGQRIHSMFGFGTRGESKEETWEGTKYRLVTLNDMMSQVMDMVNVINTVGFVVFLILLFITMLGITNTFRMILVERTREIGTIRAMGMQRGGVRNIFLLEAFFIALIGTTAGIVLSIIVMWVLSLVSFDMDNPFFIFLNNGRPTFNLAAASIVINILIISMTSLLAALFPAQKAAKLDPAKALGTHY